MHENIVHGPAIPVEPDSRGMGALFFENMKRYKDKIAQIDAHSGVKQTYSDLLLRSIRVAQGLQRKGLTSEDIISICTYNSLDSCVPMLAGFFLGIRVCSLDPVLSVSESQHLLNIVKPRLVFCGPESVETVKKALKFAGLKGEIVVFGETDVHIPFSQFLMETGTEDQFVPKSVDLFETAIIFFSSGTTGLAKGICSTHYGLLAQQYSTIEGHDTSVLMHFTTLYWISAVMWLIISMLTGGARVICRKFDEDVAMRAIQAYKVTLCFMAPTHTYKIIDKPYLAKYDTSSLASIYIGGDKLVTDQILRIKKFFSHTKIFNNYGMTEASGAITCFHAIRDRGIMEKKLLSCGRPVPGLSYKIVDVESEEILGPNKIGEICLKGKVLMKSYHNNPSENASVWDNEGYLHTGDIGYYDEDKCFYVEDRIKDVMKYQAWHVLPAELESILRTHPDVKEAAVIGIPHPTDGDHPVGFIVLKPKATVSEIDILNFFNEKVPDCKKLRGGLVFIDTIPHTPSGKPRRRDLRTMFINGN